MNHTVARTVSLLAVSVAIAGLLSVAIQAQTSSKSVVTVEAQGPAAPVASGETFTATIALKIRSGYHINAQKPSEEYLIGTSATVTPPKGFSVVRSTYPKARMGTFSFSETPIAVYDGTAQIAVTLKADAGVSAGTVSIPAKVEFQACNDDQCLPPSTVDVAFSVEVTASAAEAKQTLTVTGAPPEARVLVDGRAAGVVSPQGRAIVRDVATGQRSVRIEATGFLPFEQEVEVKADEPATLAAAMTADPNANTNAPVNANVTSNAAPAPIPATVNTNAAATIPESSSSGWLLWILGGVIVAALAGIGIVAGMRKGPVGP